MSANFPDRSPRRIEGQIWIDKHSPNNLKYYVNGHEYTVETSSSYPVLNNNTEPRVLICGTVVKLSRLGYLVPAAFPDDITDVVGVLGKTVTIPAGTSSENAYDVPVTKNGWLTVSNSLDDPTTSYKVEQINEIQSLFADYDEDYWHPERSSDTEITEEQAKSLIGAPVYWYLDSLNQFDIPSEEYLKADFVKPDGKNGSDITKYLIYSESLEKYIPAYTAQDAVSYYERVVATDNDFEKVTEGSTEFSLIPDSLWIRVGDEFKSAKTAAPNVKYGSLVVNGIAVRGDENQLSYDVIGNNIDFTERPFKVGEDEIDRYYYEVRENDVIKKYVSGKVANINVKYYTGEYSGPLADLEIGSTDVSEYFYDYGHESHGSEMPSPLDLISARLAREEQEYFYKNMYNAQGRGMLTLSTPSGYYWNRRSGISERKNVSYDNLPQVGNISAIEFNSAANTIVKVEIHMNFAKFDSSLEWTWPAYATYEKESETYPAGNINCTEGNVNNLTKTISIYHGFDLSKFTNFHPQVTYHVTGQEIEDNRIFQDSYDVQASIRELRGVEGGVCEVTVSNPYNLHYTVSGKINFRLDKHRTPEA